MQGSDTLVERLRRFQLQIDEEADALEKGIDLGAETTTDLLRYAAIGLYVRGERRVVQGVRNGLLLSLGTADWLADKLDAWTDNRVMRPFRRPVESRLKWLRQEASLVVHEGRLEERNGRVLTTRAVEELMNEVLEYMSHDPDLARLVAEQIQTQSSGLADVVTVNMRRAMVAGDGIVERVARRLFRRKARAELAPSPLAGRPQDMYRKAS